MFYDNSLKLKKMNYSTISYASFSSGINADVDESLLPIKFSPNTFNFNFDNGALTRGLGIKEAEFSYDFDNVELKKKFKYPEGVDILGAWIYNFYNNHLNKYYDIFVIYCSDKKMYYGFMYEAVVNMARMGSFTFDECPILINYNLNGKDVVLVGDRTKMYIWNYQTGTIAINNPPKITSLCVYYDKIFSTIADNKRSIYYSDDFDPTSWSMAQNFGAAINMMDEKGTLNKVVSFDDNVYVFREFGIAKVSIHSSMESFNVVQLFTSGNRIFENTVTICGDRVLFLASDGLYSFNGNTANKISLNIDTLLLKNNNQSAIGAYFNGCYYLACNVDFNDDEKIMCENYAFNNNTLLEFNINSGNLNILRGVDVVNMKTINGTLENSLVVCVNDNGQVVLGQVDTSGKVLGNATKKVWKSPKSDFNLPNRNKLIKSITLQSSTDISVEIECDGASHIINVTGSNKPITLKPNIKGKIFAINFICEVENCYISNPVVVIGY